MIQNTPEWLEMRKSKIGASDAPVIMGVNPWTTPYQLWLYKIGKSSGPVKTFRMERGLTLEPEAREEFENRTGLIVIPQVIFHPKYDWMMASPDGMDFEQENIVEIKCPGIKDHDIACQGKVPEKYIPQLQHQMEVCGLDMVYYFSYYVSEFRNVIDAQLLKVYRDQKYIDQIITKESEFWECMKNFESPELCDRDYQEKDDELWKEAAEQWKECHLQMKKWTEKREVLRSSLIKMCGKSNAKGSGISLSKVVSKGRINYHDIPEIKNVDLEKYRSSHVESFRINVDK